MTRFAPQHFGLYMGQAELDAAHQRRDDSDFQSAWSQLNSTTLHTSPLAYILQRATQHRLNDDADAGADAVAALQSDFDWLDDGKYVPAVRQHIATIHAFELVREHAAWHGQQGSWLDGLRARITPFWALEDPRPLDVMWQVTLKIAAAVALEDEALFQQGCDDFMRVIDDYLHPEGYFKPLVMVKDGKSLQRQQSATTALVLAAEAARHAGNDLWAYDNRGVSLATGCAYLVYFYFFPDKWHWEAENTYDTGMMHDIFHARGAYLEIATQRSQPRMVEMLLEERRPLFDAMGGGFTTLTHGIADVGEKPKKKRRGFFRRG